VARARRFTLVVLIVLGCAGTSAIAGPRASPRPDPRRLIAQGELQRFLVLPTSYVYASAERWAASPDAAAARPSVTRLHREGFVTAWSNRLRAWHGVNDIYPLKPGWRGVSAAVELATPDAASHELLAMVHDAQTAYPATAIEHYRPFPVDGVPGAHGFFVGHETRIAFASGRFVYVLGIGWGPGARALTVPPYATTRLDRAAQTHFKRVSSLPTD
jgi:hypothetical protein